MDKIGVYVKGDSFTPERFWSYALVTDLNKKGSHNDIVVRSYNFSQKDTDLYNSLTKEQQKKIQFLFVDGEKINY